MTLWFIRGLRRGVVTTRYPARPDASAASLPTPPAFRPQALTRERRSPGRDLPERCAVPRRRALVYDVGGAPRAEDAPPRRRTPSQKR